MRKPLWHDATAEAQIRFLQRIAIAGTRLLNRQLQIGSNKAKAERCRKICSGDRYAGD